MKRIAILLMFIVMASVCWSAAITSAAELIAQMGNAGPHTIASGLYTLTEDLDITGADWDLTLLGDVVIDGDSNTYEVTVDADAEFNVGGVYQLTFSDMIAGVRVLATAAGHKVTFNKTNFTTSGTNGLQANAAIAGETAIICNDCKAYNNDDDGFSLVGTATGSNIAMILNRCEAYWNDNVAGGGAGGGGSAGDGATAHAANQSIIINGGSYHNNGKTGVAITGTSSLSASGATFRDNGQVVAEAPNADVRVEQSRHAVIRNCTFSCTSGTGGLIPFIYSGEVPAADGSKGVSITDCTFNCANYNGYSGNIILLYPNNATTNYNYITNCLMYNIPTDKYGIYSYSDVVAGVISNCTFSGTGAVMYLRSDNLVVTKCVFDMTGASTYNGIRCAADEYSVNDLNGLNIFYGQSDADMSDYFAGVGSGPKLSDTEANPLFIDKTNGDFRTRDISPCYLADGDRIGIDSSIIGSSGRRGRYTQ